MKEQILIRCISNLTNTVLRNVVYGVLEFGYKSGILEDLLEEEEE